MYLKRVILLIAWFGRIYDHCGLLKIYLPTFLHENRLKCFFHYLFPLLLYLNQSTKKVADIGNKCDVDEEQNIRKEIVEYFTLEWTFSFYISHDTGGGDIVH